MTARRGMNNDRHAADTQTGSAEIKHTKQCRLSSKTIIKHQGGELSAVKLFSICTMKNKAFLLCIYLSLLFIFYIEYLLFIY